ncbi:MAG: ATP-binding cassette domain-containing protein [Anaerovoracaceae bacterium]
MFELKNVSKKYNGEFALKDMSLNIDKGMNFIVGPSGSGKTTLLKIISGMDQNFQGEVKYCEKEIKKLTNNERSYFYNNVFGFVWQDFNLLENSTVLENVLLPSNLKSNSSPQKVKGILKELKILDIGDQKVKYISGGQKQRVAIARELMKNPQVIIADEPTSALDQRASKTIMDILRVLSKTRTVIVVTHDTSFISEKDNVFELDKGELILKPQEKSSKSSQMKMENSNKLSVGNAFHISKTNIKNKFGRFIVSSLALMLASVLLLTIVSGAVLGSSQGEFDKLVETYGDSLTDIGLYSGFTDAAGTDGNEGGKPGGEVNQDISGLYDLYSKDSRVDFITYVQPFDEIKVVVDGKEYQITSSGSTPTINKIVAGEMPMGDTNEVVVPESFVKLLGISVYEAIGKEIKFNGSVFDWTSGQPIAKQTNVNVRIVGIMDTTVKYDYAGQVTEYTVDDSFFFSKKALSEMTKKVGKDINKMNSLLRAKTPEDMIAIKDEMNEKGIVPIGRFELVEDMVRLNSQTTEQSGIATIIIGVISIVMVIAIFLITGLMRRREYAIYKVSGFNNKSLSLVTVTETLLQVVGGILLLLITSPLLSMATKSLFSIDILNVRMLFIGAVIVLLLSAIAYATTAMTYLKTKIDVVLKAGDR